MPRLCIGTLAAILLLPALGCQAQIPLRDQQIAAAVSPAPEDLRAGATVLGYDAAGQLVTLREGTGELICLADKPEDDRFHAACYHKALDPYMARGRQLRAEGITGQESVQKRHEEADAGMLQMPSAPAMLYSLTGPADSFDPETGTVSGAAPLYVVHIPYATAASTGLSAAPAAPGAPWIMRAGTASAHIMIVPPKPEQ